MTPAPPLTAATAHVLHVGRCQVVGASREVAGPDSPRVRRITPKALAVLRVLAASPGQVVGRDELLAEVWPDSAPTDDVLTQAITHLRKAFSALDDSTAYIETIARSGYRLLVDVRLEDPAAEAAAPALSAGEAGAPVPTAPLRPRRRKRVVRRWLLVLIGVLLLVSTAALSWLLWQQRQPLMPEPSSPLAAAQRPYRLLTSTPSVEAYPALSPDGRDVAYVSVLAEGGSIIHVQRRIANSVPRLLSTPPAGAHDRFPAWSPDGLQIAFARFQPDGRCQVLLARVDGADPARVLLPCDGTELLSFDWSADGRALVFGSMAGSGDRAGIGLFHLDDERWQPLRYPRAEGDLDYSPRISADGRWLVFVRNPQLGRVYRMPADGGELQAMGNELAEIRGLTWLPDNRHVVVGRWIGMEQRLFRLDAERGTYQDMGLDDAQMPSAARHALVLAFMHRQSQSGVAAMNGAQPLKRLYAGTGHDAAPMLSPDGQQLLLLSDRNGAPALWWGRGDGSGSLKRLPGLYPDTRQAVDWSADSRHALVIGQVGQQEPGLYEVNPFTGTVDRLPVPGGEVLQAVYTDNPVRLLVLERGDDHGRLVLYDRSSQPWQALAVLPGVSQVRWDRAGARALHTRFDQPGLFSWSLRPGQAATRLNPRWPTRWRYRSWSVDGQGQVWYAHVAADCVNALSAIAGNDAAQAAPVRCLDRRRAGALAGFSTSPDGNTFLLGVTLRDGGDIGIMPLPDTAGGQFSGIRKLLIP